MSVIETCDASFALDVEPATSRLDVIEFSDLNKANSRGDPNASAKMDTVIDALAADRAGTEVRFFRISVEFDKTQDPIQVTRNTETAKRFGISSAPAVVFLRQGEKCADDVLGFTTQSTMQKKIESALAAE